MMKITTNRRLTILKYFIHAVILVIILYPPTGSRGPDPFEPRNLLIHTLPAVVLYLLNIFVYIPYLLKRRKFFSFVLIIILSFVVYGGIMKILRPERPKTTIVLNERTLPPQQRDLLVHERRVDVFPFRITLIIFLVLIGLSTSFEMILEWERQRRLQEEIQKEKITAELSLLKSQINPHFLFNILNSIYSMAVDKMDQTETAILRLSDMMRYMLYESNQDKVSLKQEIDFIQNYIDLQKLRMPQKKQTNITFNYQGKIENKTIEPILFIPFVENAFIHGITYMGNSFINIDLAVDDTMLEFKIINSKKPHHTTHKGHGMGLSNVKMRLEILYPKKHELIINNRDDYYSVLLNIHWV